MSPPLAPAILARQRASRPVAPSSPECTLQDAVPPPSGRPLPADACVSGVHRYLWPPGRRVRAVVIPNRANLAASPRVATLSPNRTPGPAPMAVFSAQDGRTRSRCTFFLPSWTVFGIFRNFGINSGEKARQNEKKRSRGEKRQRTALERGGCGDHGGG